MNAAQIDILSNRVVEEIFAQAFYAESVSQPGEVARIGWPKLSEDEVSRRIDAAIALSAEKLEKITSGC